MKIRSFELYSNYIKKLEWEEPKVTVIPRKKGDAKYAKLTKSLLEYLWQIN